MFGEHADVFSCLGRVNFKAYLTLSANLDIDQQIWTLVSKFGHWSGVLVSMVSKFGHLSANLDIDYFNVLQSCRVNVTKDAGAAVVRA